MDDGKGARITPSLQAGGMNDDGSGARITPCLQAGVFHVVCFIGFSHDLEMQG
jgi:hypothetical protein